MANPSGGDTEKERSELQRTKHWHEEEHKGFCEQPCVVTIIMKEIWSQEQGADKRHYHQLSRWIEIRRIEVIWPAHVKPSEQSAYH